MEKLVTLTVRSTHFYLIPCNGGKLLVDAGWELPALISQLRVYKIPVTDIRYILFTHHHPDHAGLVQNIKNLAGARLIIHEKQIPYLENLERYLAKKGGYEPIRVEKEDLISPDRARLLAIGVEGEILETPGHSEDSISLVLDSGIAFTGDLPAPWMVMGDQAVTVRESWKKLIDRGGRLFYPSHTRAISSEEIRRNLGS